MAEKLGVLSAAKELGLHDSQLYTWMAKARSERNRSELEREKESEIVRLKRQLAEQAEELAIAKKFAVYFARSLK
ncbi:putative IS3, transposase [Magnetofaba australis IT-1]|uniref:Putative IS3, transposase n=1 Tax=Magnetofaba australis IT-1 TaxID=1434232 RepID=A0A1Y2K4D5_9PROT|nr:putative IS3, transposase [Magnetofaba australis IT-1]